MASSIIKWKAYLQNHVGQVYEFLSICIAVSFVFWQLLNSYFCILLAAYWLFFVPKTKLGSRKLFFILLFCSTYFLTIIGVFYSNNIGEALFKVQQKVPFLIFPLLYGFTNKLEKFNIRKIFFYFSIASFLGGLTCLFNGAVYLLKSGSTAKLQGHDLVILDDMYPYMFGLCLLTGCLFWMNEWVSNRLPSSREKKGALLFFIFSAVFLLLIGNRIVIGIWLLMNIYFVSIYIKKISLKISLFVLLLVVLISGIKLNPTLRNQWNDLANFSTSNNIPLDEDKSLGRDWGGKALRIAIWKCAAGLAKEHFFMGVGTGDAQQELQKTYEKRKFYFASRYNEYNAHNQYLQETISNGVIGLLLMVAGFVLPFIYFKGTDRFRVYGFLILFFIITSITESVFETNKGIVLYTFLNSIFAFTNRKL
ncbi:MAG: O-antigen ligase family protein [Bacteroidetes bacterium]|nr:O-antigen ligase family protein [Bacteroidota bacterium]